MVVGAVVCLFDMDWYSEQGVGHLGEATPEKENLQVLFDLDSPQELEFLPESVSNPIMVTYECHLDNSPGSTPCVEGT